MFRITDIRNIAIQIEKNGEASYRQAAKSVNDPKIQEILERMADEEEQHRKWFEAIESNQSIPPEQEELEKMGKSLLQDMVANQTFSLDQNRLDQTESIAELLAQAKAFEEDTIHFYEFLLALIEDEATARELKIIIEEECQHAIRLAELVEACA